MNIQTAIDLLSCKENDLESFAVQDPFNPNFLEGYICKIGDYRYGSLVILRVNNVDVSPQVIYCTPKLHYPFSTDDLGERKFHWKLDVAYVYNKWDGTNVCAYSYEDDKGERCLTYKTRLTPVLRESKFGSFKNMWKEMIEKYNLISPIPCVLSGQYTLSFELYGYRNPILIQYDVGLDAVLLFGINQSNQQICIPQDFENQTNVPVNSIVHSISSKSDAIDFYEKLRIETKRTNAHNEDGSVVGTEGFVFYALDVDGYKMWKCKPEDIEKVHWANGGIDRNSILTTIWNSLENIDIENVTYDFISNLLREEFTLQQIERSKERIVHTIVDVQAAVAFRSKVMEAFQLGNFAIPQTEKGPVMRFMSTHFDKKNMREVYNALRAQNLLV
jgi:hypothetical protein